MSASRVPRLISSLSGPARSAAPSQPSAPDAVRARSLKPAPSSWVSSFMPLSRTTFLSRSRASVVLPSNESLIGCGLVRSKCRAQRHRRLALVGQPAGLQRLQRHAAFERRHRIADRQHHVVERDRADVEAQRRTAARWRWCRRLVGVGRSGRQVVDVALAAGIAAVERTHTARAHAVDHQLLAQQRQRLHRQRRLVDGQELVGAAVLGQLQLRHLHRDAREHRQLDRPIDHQRALAFVLHVVDRQTLEAVGVEGGDQHGGADHEQHDQRADADQGVAQPGFHGQWRPAARSH